MCGSQRREMQSVVTVMAVWAEGSGEGGGGEGGG
eukprot:CAMPEP_0119315620 /NCGR_PEP_ID=MMETSP1333-20130426/36584_1 /TAXON_ID=418940 /ORGANISM="Scyphosphaera apsteinii, Strain RCC1455" /LENGTH=33 /DNA_ID= /DNA_START= /DNA_END= /DNA_ORIENTATION=